ncbi:MAG TPA: 3-hydroxyacyl-CoA dehydrogenase [Chthoniobacterales bacterium]|nr:3-hydroxyacyl-CoA dehydrogenase [Chthoniobacterales bacterium]
MKRSPSDVTRGKAVAVVGAGLVGSGWAVVFARAGLSVKVFDAKPGAAKAALKTVEEQLIALHSAGLIGDIDSPFGRITVADTLREAVEGTAYIQESVFERVDIKREVMEDLDRVCPEQTIVGSSTSGIPASQFATGLAIASRVLIAHPVNPPYLVPVVELVPSPATAPESVEFVRELMESLGQSVVHVRKEIEGFVLNRLQGVLLREAWALVEDGVASCEDIDKTVRDGLGWRWSFMGPFETIDLNAPGGIRDYAVRLGPLYHSVARSRDQRQPWSPELMDEVERQRRDLLPFEKLAERRAWRDRQLMARAASLKKDQS